MPTQEFLGLDKGKEKFEIVVNREEAVIVCKIFRMFIQGLTPHTIAIALTAAGIPSPGGCEVWSAATVRRMLSNEKYKGDMLLQKQFTVDFLTKKVKKNEANCHNIMCLTTTSRLSTVAF